MTLGTLLTSPRLALIKALESDNTNPIQLSKIMNAVKRQKNSIIVTLLLTTVSLSSHPNDDFQKLSASYVDRMPSLSPVSATQIGDHRFDHELDHVTHESRNEKLNFYKGTLEALINIESDQLSRAFQVDAALLRHELQSNIWRLETLEEWAWNPLVYSQLLGGSVYGLLAREFAPIENRLESLASRLEQMPRLFEEIRHTLQPQRVPSVHAETALRQNKGILTMFDQMVRPAMESLNDSLKVRLGQAMKTAGDAVHKHESWIKQTLIPQASGSFRIGKELFATKLRFTLNTPLSREEVKSLAESEFKRVRREMYQVSQDIYSKQNPYTQYPLSPSEEYIQSIIRAALEVTYQDRPQRDQIPEVARAQVEAANKFIVEAQIVTPSSNPLEIILMPEFQQGVSFAYCDAPGPLDKGLKTYYAVSPIPTDWSESQVQSFLREYNIWSMHDLTMHEAVPGHFLQLAHANQYPSTLRALLASGPFIEGWAVYSERVMVDAGYLDGDPRMRLINLKWYLRGITNAMMDQAIHVDGMTREEAMRLMIEGGFQEEREAAGKWTRAQLTSAQLSTYFVGTQEHWNLRRETEERLGASFKLKSYHDKLLSFGSPPVRFARALVLDLPIPN
jgi:uncharacterized protein (DUF885 family)